jgi:general secretion pathway protein M
MITRLTALQRRAAALALAAAAVGLGYGGLVYPIVEGHRQLDERIASLRHRVEQYKRLAKDREALQQTLEQRKRMDVAKNYYLSERNPALAAGELQGLVKRAVEQAKGELISTQVTGGQRAERSAEVTVKVQVRGDVRTLQKMLYALESARPILFVNNLSVGALPLARAARLPAQAATAKDLLITLDVSAYSRERQG